MVLLFLLLPYIASLLLLATIMQVFLLEIIAFPNKSRIICGTEIRL